MKEYGRILIVNLGGLGDLLLSAPALRRIREGCPGAVIDLLCVKRSVELAKELAVFASVYALPPDPLRLAALCLFLRSRRYDLAVNMRTLATDAGARKMHALFSVIRPAVSAGRDTNGRGGFFDLRLEEKDPGTMHELDYDLGMCSVLGLDGRQPAFSLDPGDERRRRVRALLKVRGVSEKEEIVAVHPGGMASRRWPLENFRELMCFLAKEHACRFVVLGCRREAALCRSLCAGTGALDFCGMLDIMETAALLGFCRLFITNDTGPMHLAAWMDVPLVAIFGPGQRVRFDPRRISPSAAVLHSPSECAPCEKRSCSDLRCLRSVTVEEVSRAALRQLSGQEAG